jgi:hypothetical protein
VGTAEHAPQNVLEDPGDVARFHDCCSNLMRELLDGLAAAPGTPRTFPQVEDAIGWPRRRVASVLGGVCHLRQTEFGGRRPYHLNDARWSVSGRWEIWMDESQARALASISRMDPADPVAALERWIDHGAGYRVLELSADRAVLELRACTGEPVDRLESADPELIRYVRELDRDVGA